MFPLIKLAKKLKEVPPTLDFPGKGAETFPLIKLAKKLKAGLIKRGTRGKQMFPLIKLAKKLKDVEVSTLVSNLGFH